MPAYLPDPSSRWARPVSSTNRRVNGTGVEPMGRLIYSTAHRADGTGPVHSSSNPSNDSKSNLDYTYFALVQMTEPTIENRQSINLGDLKYDH